MDKFEEYKMKKIRPIIRNWFDWFIKQSVMGKEQKKKIETKQKTKYLMIFGDFLILKKKKKRRI